MATATSTVYALLADGTTAEIRPARAEDLDAVQAMHEAMSPDNIYLRFFSLSRTAAGREAQRICHEPAPGHVALLALAGGEVVGCGSYDVAGPDGTAEVAFAVADTMHHRGIATLLLEHLASFARSHQVQAFSAQTLSENTAMQRVFADAGLPVTRHLEGGVVEMRVPLAVTTDSYLDTVQKRERTAGAASLRHLLAPESVVVVGAGHQGTVGMAILDNIRAAGYAGRLYAVSPHASQIPGSQMAGVRCLPLVADLPEAPDLAVLAVPAPAVLEVADECGRLGVRALTVISSGLGTAECADLLSTCRRYGMRLAGPDSAGIAVPSIGLDATFAAAHPEPGIAGVVTQSGGLGLAMIDQLSRLGIGISSFASVGSKLDVSGNDMLSWWDQDSVTRLAVLYIESFGNPRKFARTARQVSARMPVLTVHAGRSEAGQQATAAATPPLISRQALFEQAGIIATPGFGELIEATALLASQPVPAGRTVAIVSSTRGAGVLAADSCTDLGLKVHRPRGLTRRKLRALLPSGSAVNGPIDMTGAVSAGQFRQCLELLAAEEDVSAIIAIVLPTAATGDLVSAIEQAEIRIPLAAVLLSQAESVQMLAGGVPCYGYPEAAAAALARAAAYGAWRAEPRGTVPAFAEIRAEDARTLVRENLTTASDGWLLPEQSAELLQCYGIPLAGPAPAAGEGGAEVIVKVTDDHMFGPLIVVEIGCSTAGPPAGDAARLAPLTGTDADTLIRSIGSAPLLSGQPAASLAALRDLLLRVSRLADDLPEVSDLTLGVVIARPEEACAVNAQIRITARDMQDPFLRRLR